MAQYPIDTVLYPNPYDKIKRISLKIATELKKEYPGKLLSKGGIATRFELPHVFSTYLFRELVKNHGFIEVNRFNLRVPEN